MNTQPIAIRNNSTAMMVLPPPPLRCPAVFATPFSYTCLLLPLATFFKNGPRKSTNPKRNTHEMVEATVGVIQQELARLRSETRVALETQQLKKGNGKIKGFIVHHHGTTVVPLAISQNLVRLRDNPTFVAQKNGAAELLNAFLYEMAAVMDLEVEAMK